MSLTDQCRCLKRQGWYLNLELRSLKHVGLNLEREGRLPNFEFPQVKWQGRQLKQQGRYLKRREWYLSGQSPCLKRFGRLPESARTVPETSSRDVASGFAQDALDCSLFGLFENGSVVIRGGPVLDECEQVFGLYEVRRPEQQRPVDGVLQFADVTRPVVVKDLRHGFRGNAFHDVNVPFRLEEVLDQ